MIVLENQVNSLMNEQCDTIRRVMFLLSDASPESAHLYLEGTRVHQHLREQSWQLMRIFEDVLTGHATPAVRTSAWKASQQILENARCSIR